eukprot:CAMPEP_0177657404 /NCGR_PEP_ID=MMETSP0447-20121125/16163_1 /TAXON_ID=0 /ORGANISM="Stygamoeba regulata, Strain BSH-02190019" /LENGTH=329 /DNA_ID=CAMNT_0019161749 /DNA_START=70 /DNA_END=1059 /DNA_ORIENTATION=+
MSLSTTAGGSSGGGSGSGGGGGGGAGFPVHLNVYDLITHPYLDPFGLCAYHTGVELEGREYAFFGSPSSESGVHSTIPRQIAPPAQFRTSIFMGHCTLTREQIRDRVLIPLSVQYRGNVYHRLRRNCNHFSNDMCLLLLNKPIPRWINRLAWWGSWFEGCLPVSITGDMLTADDEDQVDPLIEHVHSDYEAPVSFAAFEGASHRMCARTSATHTHTHTHTPPALGMSPAEAGSSSTSGTSMSGSAATGRTEPQSAVRIQVRMHGERFEELFDRRATFSDLYARVSARAGHTAFELLLAFPKARIPRTGALSLIDAGLNNTLVLYVDHRG